MAAFSLNGMAEFAPALAVLAAPSSPGTFRPFDPAELQGQKAIVIFWRHDCAPCRKEAAALPSLAEAGGVPLVLASLSNAEETARYLPKALPHSVGVRELRAPVADSLQAYGDRLQALPFSVAFHADGSVCAQHYGPLGTETASAWGRTC